MAQNALSLFAATDIPETATPLMAQYGAIKKQYEDYLLFFRLGDFYELFFDDAVKASAALDIALTKRGKHQGAEIPMCGVPWHQADGYLARLIRQGFRVAICDQVESDAPQKPGKGLIERKVVRVITPGTVTEDSLLDGRRNNFILCLAGAQNQMSLAWIDVSTGAFFIEDGNIADLGNILARIEPGEILLSEKSWADPDIAAALTPYKARLSIQPHSRFSAENAEDRLCRLYNIKSLDGIGSFSRAALIAAGALTDYVQLTQQGSMPCLAKPQWQIGREHMQIDAATARNLELRRKLSGEQAGSLLHAIDRTLTNSGGRMLDAWMASPLAVKEKIDARLDAVEYLLQQTRLRGALRAILRHAADIERASTRLMLNRGNPRDLSALRDGLAASRETSALLQAEKNLPAFLAEVAQNLGSHQTLEDELRAALADDLPHFTRDGNFIRKGYSAELDHMRELRDESQRLIAGLQNKYVQESGVATLKIRHNNILGYYIEVPPKQADRMGAGFIHRQTLATTVRYTTPELNEMEQKLSKAAAGALGTELQIFANLVDQVQQRAAAIQLAAAALALLDVVSALADLAEEQNYCRPEIGNDTIFDVQSGRHPVVEQFLRAKQQPFIANDCDLASQGRLWLITGPNMAGKSTYLRQNALIAILAQMGSFVPAASCRIGLVDKIFSRVGAADDLARGQSTFMVEMVEAAAILNQATAKSLVILDEIGRGTSTFDGLSIAWAVLEYLHDTSQCRGLFATHYHELTALAERLSFLSCHTMRISDDRGEVVFLHEVQPGVAERSYGIHVAKLAGLPQPVLARAAEILQELENGDHVHAPKSGRGKAKISISPRAAPVNQTAQLLLDELQLLNPDDLSPRAAWDALDRLKKLSKK